MIRKTSSEKRKPWKKIAAAMLALILIISGSFKREKKRIFSAEHITGLYFHNPSRAVFERSICWLKKNDCVFISSDELLDILNNKIPFPRRGVWITFDDGWRANLSEVLPVMLKYNIPLTFFISSGPVENSGVFWFSLVRTFRDFLPSIYQNNLQKLWSIDEKQRKAIVEELEKKCSPLLVREALSVNEIKAISRIPLVTIGSHTVNHVITVNCTDAELEAEISNASLKLEQWTGKKVRFFAYPNGDYGGRERKFLREAGIKLAATTRKEFISKKSDLYSIPRFCVNDDAFLPEIICQLVGVWGKWMDSIGNICSRYRRTKSRSVERDKSAVKQDD